jgi:capsular polysaccharide transport system permease protein
MTAHEIRLGWQKWKTAIRIQIRIVTALIRREMRVHFGESRLGYLWALVEPTIHLTAFLLVFTFLIRRNVSLGTSTALFLLTGIVPYFLYSKMASYVSGAVGANRALLQLPPVKPLDVVLARGLLEAATYLFVGFLMFLALYVGGISDAIPSDPLAVMEACALAICLGFGVGMINIVIVSFFHNWMSIYGITSFPLWMFSGVWFLPEQVPQPYRDYMLYNPLMHIIMCFRMGFYRDFKAVFFDGSYVTGVSALALAMGLLVMQVARRKVLEPT